MADRSYHHGALHRAILDAAVEEARRSGPQGVQVRALAKTVGVSPAAIYRHVPNIDTLLAEVAQVSRQDLAVALADRRDGVGKRRTRKATAQARFAAIGRGYIDFAVTEPRLFDTAFAPTTVCPDRPDDPSPWQVLVDGIDELVAVGAVRAEAADRAAIIAWAGVHGIASILVRQALTGPTDGESAIDAVLDGIRRAIESL